MLRRWTQRDALFKSEFQQLVTSGRQLIYSGPEKNLTIAQDSAGIRQPVFAFQLVNKNELAFITREGSVSFRRLIEIDSFFLLKTAFPITSSLGNISLDVSGSKVHLKIDTTGGSWSWNISIQNQNTLTTVEYSKILKSFVLKITDYDRMLEVGLVDNFMKKTNKIALFRSRSVESSFEGNGFTISIQRQSPSLFHYLYKRTGQVETKFRGTSAVVHCECTIGSKLHGLLWYNRQTPESE